MADEGKPGSKGSFRRNERRRREPPIIDAKATDVSEPAPSATEPEVSEPETSLSDWKPGDVIEPAPSVPETSGTGQEPDRPQAVHEEAMLGGTGQRGERPTTDAQRSIGESEALGNAEPMAGGVESEPPADKPAEAEVHGQPGANGAPVLGEFDGGAEPARPADKAEFPQPEASPMAGAEPPPDPPFIHEPLPSAATSSSGGFPGAAEPSRSPLPIILGAVALALLAGIVVLLATEPQRNGSADIDKLKQQVAALESRPQPTFDTSQIATLGNQTKDLAGQFAALKASLSDLTGKADTAARQAQDNAGRIEALEHKPAEPATPTASAAPAGASAETPQAQSADLSALTTKLDELDKRLTALAATPAAPVPAPTGGAAPEAQPSPEVADLKARLDGLQASLATIPKVDLAPIRAQFDDLSRRVAETNQANATLTTTLAAIPKVDLAPVKDATAELDKRVGALEGTLSAPKAGDRVTEARAVGDSDTSRAAPLAVVAQAIGQAIEDGRPFPSELDALKALGVDAPSMATLAPLAAKGAPTAEAVKAQWAAVEPGVLKATQPQPSNVLDRFAASARTLVEVRPVGAPAAEGDSPTALTARVGSSLDRGDLSGALAEWSKLPEAGRAVSQTWADAARSRLDAGTEVQALLSRAIAALGKAGG